MKLEPSSELSAQNAARNLTANRETAKLPISYTDIFREDHKILMVPPTIILSLR